MTIHTIRQFDTEQPIDEILRDGDGIPIDLQTAEAVYLHVGKKGQPPMIHRQAIIHDPSPSGQALNAPNRGRVRFEFIDGETTVRGQFPREWWIRWGAGRDQRIPNGLEDDYLLITRAVAEDDN